MSTGDPRNRPRVVRQGALFGGTDVLCLYGENGRIRTNRFHCDSDARTTALVRQTRQLERAELVELPDGPMETRACPRCGRTGGSGRARPPGGGRPPEAGGTPVPSVCPATSTCSPSFDFVKVNLRDVAASDDRRCEREAKTR